MHLSLQVFLIISGIIWLVFMDAAAICLSIDFICDKIREHRKRRNEKPVDRY